MDTVLEVDRVVTRFGSDVIHDGVSFAIKRGEVVALIGGSGTGKSVLLKEIIGLLRPTRGAVSLFGTDVWSASDAHLNELRGRFGMKSETRRSCPRRRRWPMLPRHSTKEACAASSRPEAGVCTSALISRPTR